MPVLALRARTLLIIAAAVLAALVAAIALRFLLIDATVIAQACEAGEASLRCTIRFALNESFRTNYPGMLAVLVGLVAFVRPTPLRFAAALVLSAICLVLFNAWPGGLAITLALLALVRPARSRATA